MKSHRRGYDSSRIKQTHVKPSVCVVGGIASIASTRMLLTSTWEILRESDCSSNMRIWDALRMSMIRLFFQLSLFVHVHMTNIPVKDRICA